MTTYWVLLLAVLVVAAVILLVVLNRSGSNKTTVEKGEAAGEKRDTSKPVRPVTEKKPEEKKEPVKLKKPPEKKIPETPVNKEPVIIKKHTPVYEYTPTRGTVRCRTCDGENAHGSAMCGICGNYLTY